MRREKRVPWLGTSDVSLLNTTVGDFDIDVKIDWVPKHRGQRLEVKIHLSWH